MESLSDIVAQMRGRGEDGRMDRRLWLEYADRIEAAAKRERAPVGNVAAMRMALERLDALNLNVLKYPLDGDSSEIYDADKKTIPLPMWGVATLLNGAKEAQVLASAALSAPARQCDVGTAEEQAERFGKLCGKHYNEEEPCNEKCPLASLPIIHGFPRCQAYWAQTPYEEKGAGNDK